MLVEILKIFGFFILFFICFITLAIVLKAISDNIESNPFATENASKKLICLFIALHFVLLVIKLPLISIAFSLTSHLAFLWFYSDYPALKAKDLRFIAALVLTFINHFYLTIEFRKNFNSGWQVLFGFMVIWGTPLIVVFNLSANQDTVVLESKKRKASMLIGSVFEKFQSFKNKLKN